MDNDNGELDQEDCGTLDTSLEDEQTFHALEDADRYRESIEVTQARVDAFEHFVEGLDSLSDTQEEIQANPYDYGQENNQPNYDQAVDGLLIGVTAGALLFSHVGQACSEWYESNSGNESDDLQNSDIDFENHDTTDAEEQDFEHENFDETFSNETDSYGADDHNIDDYSIDDYGDDAYSADNYDIDTYDSDNDYSNDTSVEQSFEGDSSYGDD